MFCVAVGPCSRGFIWNNGKFGDGDTVRRQSSMFQLDWSWPHKFESLVATLATKKTMKIGLENI